MKLTKLFGKIGIVTAAIGTAIVFCACENFLKGAELQKELERQIYIAGQDCPVAKVEEPAWTNDGVGKNRAIIISFTKSMATANFLDCLTITDEMGNDVKKHFLAPQWYNDNKYVLIAASETNPISLDGKKTMDIKVTLSKAFQTPDGLPITNAIDHTYRIADKTDSIAPELKKSEGQIPPEYIGRSSTDKTIKLEEGNLTSETEEKICKTNHMGTKVDFYIEGNDRGASVWAYIMYRRCYDTLGNIKNEDFKTCIQKLEDITDSGNSSGTVCLELPRSDYADGMYEVRIYVQNSANIKSNSYSTFYIVRDTINTFNYNTAVGFWSEQFRTIEDFSFYEPGDTWETIKSKLQEHFNDSNWDGSKDIGWYEWSMGVPTGEYLNEIANGHNLNFDNIPDDVYFASVYYPGKVYKDNFYAYKYFICWGLDLNNMTTPVEVFGKTEEEVLQNPADKSNYFPLPQEFQKYRKDHEDKEIYLRAVYIDSAGNENTITGLAPKKVDLYNYKVEDDADNSTVDNPKKQVTLNFDDISRADTKLLKNLPDKKLRIYYRIFYAELEPGHPDNEAYYDSLELKRYFIYKWDEDCYGDKVFYDADPNKSHILKNLKDETEYLVYIQTNYETDSIHNNQWNGSYFSPLTRVIVDTGFSGSNAPAKPVFTMTKESAGKNTGLFNVTITLDPDVYDANGENTKYIPCYSVDGGYTWIYYESQSTSEFTISVQNPLHMPIKNGERWWYKDDGKDWDNYSTIGNQYDNTYWEAVEGCKEAKGYPAVEAKGYPAVEAKVKIIAVNKDTLMEAVSDPDTLTFTEDDDNIPPYTPSGVIIHDSHLSFDGTLFLFEGVIREEEGHLCDTFEYYYTPYQDSWGSSLSALSREEIERLPHNTAYFESSCWIDYEDENKTIIKDMNYYINAVIPLYGMEDGQYMFYAYVKDTYGNDAFLTLGKGNVGTFKNKPKVKVEFVEDPGISKTIQIPKKFDDDGNTSEYDSYTFDYPAKHVYHFKTSLELDSADPQDSNTKYMINIQKVWDGGSDNFYGFDNGLQYCKTGTNDEGKLSVFYETENCKDAVDHNSFLVERPKSNGVKYDDNPNIKDNTGYLCWVEGDNSGIIMPFIPYQLLPWQFYKITVQAFNLNEYNSQNGTGVNLRYGLPYSTYDASSANWGRWRGQFTWVESENEYDLCTRETVSYPIYVYLPGLYRVNPDGSEYTSGENYDLRQEDNFYDGIKASFSASNARPRSNRPFLVNVIACSRDLGNDANEWERRGKVIASHVYYPDYNTSIVKDDNDDIIQFDSTVAADDMYNSDEKGFMYYVAVVHFANGESAVSEVYSTYCY